MCALCQVGGLWIRRVSQAWFPRSREENRNLAACWGCSPERNSEEAEKAREDANQARMWSWLGAGFCFILWGALEYEEFELRQKD